MGRERADHHENELADSESDQPWEGAVHETVGMQTDAEHVDAEPRPGCDNVTEDGHNHKPTLPNEPAPAGVQDDRVPQDNEQRAVFFRIPSPKTTPGLIGPDSTEDRSDET